MPDIADWIKLVGGASAPAGTEVEVDAEATAEEPKLGAKEVMLKIVGALKGIAKNGLEDADEAVLDKLNTIAADLLEIGNQTDDESSEDEEDESDEADQEETEEKTDEESDDEDDSSEDEKKGDQEVDESVPTERVQQAVSRHRGPPPKFRGMPANPNFSDHENLNRLLAKDKEQQPARKAPVFGKRKPRP